jgi:hypothetical protein
MMDTVADSLTRHQRVTGIVESVTWRLLGDVSKRFLLAGLPAPNGLRPSVKSRCGRPLRVLILAGGVVTLLQTLGVSN